MLSTGQPSKRSVSEHYYFHELNLRNNGIFVFLEDILLVVEIVGKGIGNGG